MLHIFKNREKPEIILTQDTVRGVMLEKARHPGVECIIQMPGVRIGNRFYFDMVADSGINATYRAGMCEKDHIYIDHLSTRIAEYYDIPPDQLTVSQVHFHPPGFARFSAGDGPANIKLARQFNGVVCGIFLIDPEFRMLFWYIDRNGRETPVEYVVDDSAVRRAMPRRDLEWLKRVIEKNENSVVFRSRKDDAPSSAISKYHRPDEIMNGSGSVRTDTNPGIEKRKEKIPCTLISGLKTKTPSSISKR